MNIKHYREALTAHMFYGDNFKEAYQACNRIRNNYLKENNPARAEHFGNTAIIISAAGAFKEVRPDVTDEFAIAAAYAGWRPVWSNYKGHQEPISDYMIAKAAAILMRESLNGE